MTVSLEVGGFDVDGGVGMTMIKAHINIQECDGRGNVPNEFDQVTAIEVFKEL
jgi:hypothetical protein